MPTVNQQSRRPHRPWVGPLLCPANAYISLRKAQAALNILLNAIHLSAELNGRIPGTGPLAKINSVRRLCGILFPDNHKKKKKTTRRKGKKIQLLFTFLLAEPVCAQVLQINNLHKNKCSQAWLLC